jgi:hypothetical protein
MEAHNGLSARIVEEAGFKGIWASGLSISAAMGVRDNNEASWTQVLETVEFMSYAVSIPILLDGDTGFGNFNNVRRLVRKLEQRGVAALCIEDKLFPKTNSFINGERQPLADLEEFAGKIKAVIPGGSSCPVVPGEIIMKTNMDYDALKAAGSSVGSAAVIVMDETTCMVRVLERLSRFYMSESCGQCTPCREGTGWLDRMLKRILAGQGRREDIDLLVQVANKIEGHTICGLGDAAAWPVQSFVKHFRHEFEYMIDHGGRSIVNAQQAAA